MASLGSWLWGTTQLDDAVDRATSELLPTDSEDIALNLEICDQIRSKSVSAKEAMRAIKRRLNHKNPNVQLLALGLTDICIKNGGDHFLVEVASREFMDNLVSIVKIPVLNMDVKNKMLRLIQNWAIAFEGKTSLSYVGQVYKTLKNEGFKFPPEDMALANSAMVDTQTAPEWIDSDVCLRCRTPFTFTNRKHHCRNCGQVFDQQCSSKTMSLPHFGITQEVRVCDGCYLKLNKKSDKHHHHSQSMPTSRHRSARDIADAELQRAIQLSLEEAGLSNATPHRPGYTAYQPSQSDWQTSEPPLVDSMGIAASTRRPTASELDEEDPDLRAAIEASLREANAPKPSAPIAAEEFRSAGQALFYSEPSQYSTPGPSASAPSSTLPRLPNHDLEAVEEDAILTFNQTVEQMHAQGITDIARYPGINDLYTKANTLRPKLAVSMDDSGRKEEVLTDMHLKLTQAVKLYDRLLTERVSSSKQLSSQPNFVSSPLHPAASWSLPMDQPQASRMAQNQINFVPGPPVAHGYNQGSHTTSQPPMPTPPILQTAPSYYPNPAPYGEPAPLDPRSRAANPLQNGQASRMAQHQTNFVPGSPVAPVYDQGSYTTSQPRMPTLPPSQTAPSYYPNPAYGEPAPPDPRTRAANPLQNGQARVAAPLPNFPSVPTVVPHFSTHDSPLPSPTERKEALLIDL